VDDDVDNRDAKSRHVLKKLKNGNITYHKNGKYFCPFCDRIIAKSYDSLLSHATGIGRGGRKRSAVTKDKHAAFGLFLQKYVMWQ
jgi:hypothetical protein